MRQKVQVRAIIRHLDKTLFVGDLTQDGDTQVLNLPGGKLQEDFQPEQSMAGYIKQYCGCDVGSIQLFKVVNLSSKYDKSSRIIIVFLATLTGVCDESKGSKVTWLRKSDLQHYELTDVAKSVLNIEDVVYFNDKTTTYSQLIIYSDGGSRGNPGLSAAGYVIEDSSGNVVKKDGIYLGVTTSAQAEYYGLKAALEAALSLGAKNVECRLDSLMVVNQMKGIYQVKNRQLWPIHEYILDLVSQYDSVTFRHVRREFNTQADQEVNRVLDERSKH